MTRSIDNNDDVIDSRDVIARIAELELLGEDRDEYEELELAVLATLEANATDYSEDWQYGATLIHDYYFVKYAQELADDIGAVPADASWPLTCIDWAQAARELQQDYTSVDFGGVTYWVR